MGLFSLKKSKSTDMPIPADILAAVNVNGEKTVLPQVTVPPIPEVADVSSTTISPFLKGKSPIATPEPPAALPVAEENAGAPVFSATKTEL